MTRRRKALLQTAQSVLAHLADKIWTTLGRAPHTAQSLWNRNSPEPPEVKGCLNCGIVYRFDVFYWGGVEHLKRCPSCGDTLVLNLGQLPNTVRDETGTYLIGRTGFCTGPYESEEDAQDHLWDWFAQKEDSDGRQEEGEEESNQEGGQEKGHEEEGIKEKRNRAWGHLRLAVSNGEVRFPDPKDDLKRY